MSFDVTSIVGIRHQGPISVDDDGSIRAEGRIGLHRSKGGLVIDDDLPRTRDCFDACILSDFNCNVVKRTESQHLLLKWRR